MVGRETFAAEASSSCDQPTKVRAAFSCLIDTFSIDTSRFLIDTKSIEWANDKLLLEFAMSLDFSAISYRTIRDRIRGQDPQIDEQTLADTVEGLTDLHEILTAVIRAALCDQALATGLNGRIGEMQARRDRLQDRAAKRRQIAKDVMVELDLKKLSAPDFTASIRPGTPALMVIDEAAVPSIYWEPREPLLNRQGLANDLKQGAETQSPF